MFEMASSCLMHYYLGIEIWQRSGKFFISQQKCEKEILKAFGMSECKEISIPMEVNAKLSIIHYLQISREIQEASCKFHILV